MPAERYFYPHSFEEHAEIKLEDQEFHHLVNVMRAKEKERVELVNGDGQLAIATITAIEKKRAYLTIESLQTAPPTSPLILAQAIPRGNRLDFILEKGTELGMTELWLFPGKLGERQLLTDKQLERMKALTIAAMKQCGRLYLPKITLHPPLTDWISLPYPAFFGDTRPEAPPLTKKASEGIIFFIGPESGLHESEIKSLETLGTKGVKLHPNILRTDTAALAALALLSSFDI